MSDRVRESLRVLLGSIREELKDHYIDEKTATLGSHTLVIGTGSAQQVSHLIGCLHNLFPETVIHCIARPNLIPQLEASLNNQDKAYAYKNDGFFDTKGILETIPNPAIQLIESAIGVLNNVWGAGYENVYKILEELKLGHCYTFNVEERFSRVTPSSAKKRIENLTLNKVLSEWYWENGFKASHDN